MMLPALTLLGVLLYALVLLIKPAVAQDNSTAPLFSNTTTPLPSTLLTQTTSLPSTIPPADVPSAGIPASSTFTLNPTLLSVAVQPTDSVPIPPLNASILLAPPPDPAAKFSDLHMSHLNESLPDLMSQLGVPSSSISALSAEGAPLINDALTALFNAQSVPATSRLHRRGLFSSIKKFVSKVVKAAVSIVTAPAVALGCSVFATSALPGYLLSAQLFAVQNIATPSFRTTPDQDFYIQPLHGPVSHTDGIAVFYNAHFPPGFSGAAATTFGRRIYVRAGPAGNAADANFKTITKLLLHEFTHVKQYQSLGYNLPAFGTRYLFEYCKAGFSYSRLSLEAAAFTQQELMNALLTDPIGSQFVRVWKARGVQASLGLPVARTYSKVGGGGWFGNWWKWIGGAKKPAGKTEYTLQMQRGFLRIACDAAGVCS